MDDWDDFWRELVFWTIALLLMVAWLLLLPHGM